MSRDPTSLNNLGLALLAAGVLIALTTWLARFTSKAVPWWPVIAGMVVIALGLALALATIGARREAMSGSSTGNIGKTEPSESAAPRGEKAKVDEATWAAQKYGVHVRGDVQGLAQGDNQIVTMNFGTPSTDGRDNKRTGAEPPVHDGE